MKHGVATRKFSRTSSHRMLMLRNLVTSLFEHEQIKTTLPKARDTARLAEKMITLSKKGGQGAFKRAAAFILKPSILPKLFGNFASRYANRPGGYTRIHKFGNRPGDNAPHAILELVDNPKDLRFELTARSIGWELLRENLTTEQPLSLINHGIQGAQDFIYRERRLGLRQQGRLREKTRWNLQKVLKYRDVGAAHALTKKAGDYIDNLLAYPLLLKARLGGNDALADSSKEPRRDLYKNNFVSLGKAGQMVPGESRGALRLARSTMAKPRWEPSWRQRKAVADSQPSR